MKKNNFDPSDLPDHKIKGVSSFCILQPIMSKPTGFLIVAVSFLMLTVAVFFSADYFARKGAVGHPNFQDYQMDLFDQNGRRQTTASYLNQPIALFFGFTYCPDVCPTTLMNLTVARDGLQSEGIKTDELQFIFVTVDPERDTSEQLKQYLSLFDADVVGLTGTAQNIALFLKQFGVYVKRTEQADGDYLLDHSAAVFLYRADGSFKGTIVHNEPIDFIREKLKSIL